MKVGGDFHFVGAGKIWEKIACKKLLNPLYIYVNFLNHYIWWFG